MRDSNVSSAANFNGGIATWFKQVEGLFVEDYRKLIWEIFKRILINTPQWSGRAVANWNLSIGEPNLTYDPTLGDDLAHMIEPEAPHKAGDSKWIRIATSRNWPILQSVRYRDKVFISNGVKGDAGLWHDGQKNSDSFAYLEAMQVEGSPWHQSLRDVNLPYETVQETIVTVATLRGRKGLTLPRVGGQLWSEQ